MPFEVISATFLLMHMAVAFKRACFGQFAQADGSDILGHARFSLEFLNPPNRMFQCQTVTATTTTNNNLTNGYVNKVKKDGYKLDNDQKILTITGK